MDVDCCNILLEVHRLNIFELKMLSVNNMLVCLYGFFPANIPCTVCFAIELTRSVISYIIIFLYAYLCVSKKFKKLFTY